MADILTLTRDDILNAFLRDYRSGVPDANTSTNSDAWVKGTAVADVCLPFYANGIQLGRDAFPGSASESALKLFGSTYNVPRLGAINASGTVTVNASVAMTIGDGAPLVNPTTGENYKTVGATVIPSGTLTATAFVVALDPGTGGNADPGTVLNFTATPPGLDPVATVLSVSGGDAEWTTGRWAKEILLRMRQAPRSGNIAHFIALGLTLPGLEQTFVYPALRGRGTMDIVLTTSAASGSRVAGTALISQYFGTLQYGAQATGGAFIPGIPADVLANTAVSPVVEQQTDVLIGYEASAANPFDVWPPAGDVGDSTTWYTVKTSVSSITAFTVQHPTTGTSVAPIAGNTIGIFFPSVGYAKATILGVTVSGSDWDITTTAWTPTPTETSLSAGKVITPWCSQLPLIAGPPDSGSLALSGAVPTFFAGLGPGEMTPLTTTDTTRRRRWPRTTDTDPLTGLVEWPTDVTGRLAAQILDATDAADLTATTNGSTAKTPDVPLAAYIGTPPSILVLNVLSLIRTG